MYLSSLQFLTFCFFLIKGFNLSEIEIKIYENVFWAAENHYRVLGFNRQIRGVDMEHVGKAEGESDIVFQDLMALQVTISH